MSGNNNLGEKCCCICNTEGVIDNFFICKGIMCNSVAHYSCAGIKCKSVTTFKNNIANCKGLSWSCPDCDMNLKDLLVKITDLTNKISNATSIPLTEKQVPVASTVGRVTRLQSKKLHLTIDSDKTTERPASVQIDNINAVQISKTPNTDGPLITEPIITNNENIESISDNQDQDTIVAVKPRRWLFISRIDPSVTDIQFKEFIKNKFHLMDINALRMIPKARNGFHYNYISYRLSVDDKAFSILLNSKSWPSGLFIKEFDFSQKKSFFWGTRATNTAT